MKPAFPGYWIETCTHAWWDYTDEAWAGYWRKMTFDSRIWY
ncbi:hypothetical protein [Laspinema olomoucense]|nr:MULTISPECIES: hypothetical protein [unclassified Laspinema]